MAGEWLKFEASTPEKPEVFAITAALGWDDPDLTVGKLLKVWRWFDQHTINGNAASVSLALLDRISGVSGLAQAMCNVGWLTEQNGGLALPHFDRHNGQTAKDRAQTAKRVAKHKTNAEGNAVGVSAALPSALPREEKRREEKEKKEPKSKTEAATPSAFPDWLPSDCWAAFVEMRKAIKKPITPGGIPLAMQKLDTLRAAGNDPRAVLEQSTLNSWQGLFEIKPQYVKQGAQSQKFNFANADRSGDQLAQAESMARHGITSIPDGDIEI